MPTLRAGAAARPVEALVCVGMAAATVSMGRAMSVLPAPPARCGPGSGGLRAAIGAGRAAGFAPRAAGPARHGRAAALARPVQEGCASHTFTPESLLPCPCSARFTTAISGLTSQSRALGHISDNVANSQTVGFKRVDTNFVSYLTQSDSTTHSPGPVIARPDYTNALQGTIEQSESPLAMAIGGQGFFSVAASAGTAANGLPRFDERQFFSRAGDFSLDEDGYLVNGAGYYLQGWPADAAGNPDRTTLEPIRLDQQVFNPVPTGRVELAANLPADGARPRGRSAPRRSSTTRSDGSIR